MAYMAVKYETRVPVADTCTLREKFMKTEISSTLCRLTLARIFSAVVKKLTGLVKSNSACATSLATALSSIC